MVTAQKATQKKVFICSPFRPSGTTEHERADDLRKNREMARLACRYAVSQGCMPMVPHLFFPEFLSENEPDEREAGIRFGLDWLKSCDELWVIGTKVTEGMLCEISEAVRLGIPVIQRIFVLIEEDRADQRKARADRPIRRVRQRDPGYDDYDGYFKFRDKDEEGILYDGD